MTYLDLLSRRNRGARSLDDDSDSDSGPPPDPDEPSPLPAPKKEKKKTTGESKEVQVSTRKTDDKGMLNMQSGISAARREILQAIRAEEDEGWLTLEFQSEDGTVCHFLELSQMLSSPIRWTPFFRRMTVLCSVAQIVLPF